MAAMTASMTVVPAAVAAIRPCEGRTSVTKAPPMLPAATPSRGGPSVSHKLKDRHMKVWQPTDNKYFETFSYLPPLTSDQIAKQVDYIINNGWVPCIEFAESDKAYVTQSFSGRMGPVTSGYEDNRYWTMFKLPMFGCSDPSQVLREMQNAIRSFPDAYIRLVAFDNIRQTQVCGFLLHRPTSVSDYRAPLDRSI